MFIILYLISDKDFIIVTGGLTELTKPVWGLHLVWRLTSLQVIAVLLFVSSCICANEKVWRSYEVENLKIHVKLLRIWPYLILFQLSRERQ